MMHNNLCAVIIILVMFIPAIYMMGIVRGFASCVGPLRGSTTLDGYVVSKDGYVVNKDGYVVSKDGYVVNKDGYVVNKDGYVVNKDGYVVNKEGYVVNKDDYVVNKEHMTRTPPMSCCAYTSQRGIINLKPWSKPQGYLNMSSDDNMKRESFL